MAGPADEGAAPRRRGRRAAGADTRGELLAAAATEFGEHGLDGTSMRGVARRAGVDAKLVHHYFGSKEELFTESVVSVQYLPVAVRALADVSRDDAAETLVRTLLSLWGRMDGRGTLRAVVASVVRSEMARDLFRELLLRRLLLPLVRRLEVDEPERRAGLVASQVIGLGMVRFVLKIEPLASADVETVVAEVAPTVARYLFDPLPPPAVRSEAPTSSG